MTRDEALKILGLPAGSLLTESEIKTAYKKMAKTHHPDKCPNTSEHEATEDFKQISEAYQFLKRLLAGQKTLTIFSLHDMPDCKSKLSLQIHAETRKGRQIEFASFRFNYLSELRYDLNYYPNSKLGSSIVTIKITKAINLPRGSEEMIIETFEKLPALKTVEYPNNFFTSEQEARLNKHIGYVPAGVKALTKMFDALALASASASDRKMEKRPRP